MHYPVPTLLATSLFVAACGTTAVAFAGGTPLRREATIQSSEADSEITALKAQLQHLQARVPPPELGRQMLELQMRHDRLWWAGEAGNWTLAYYMTGELGEALRGIEESNGEAPELQPQKLSEIMPSIMNPAIKQMQEALATQKKGKFEQAFDRLSASCNACHAEAGVGFLHIERPRTPLLDNLRYAPSPK